MTATGLSPAHVQVLGCVAHHRLLTTPQVRELRGPTAGQRWTQHTLAQLEHRGLVGAVWSHGHRKLWHATPNGAQLAEEHELTDRPKALAPDAASGALHAHTLAVNDVGIAFLKAARERGDDFGPLGWRHEIAHPLTTGRGGRRLIADALLTYLHTGPQGESLQYRLIELDRATLSVDRLAAKLDRYHQLHNATTRTGEPVWRRWYPTFPAVHLIFTNANRPALERRRRALHALHQAHHPHGADGPAISICLLDDLQSQGPFGAIFQRLDNDADDPVDWLGDPPATPAGRA